MFQNKKTELRGNEYVCPSVVTLDFVSEGLLCLSDGDFTYGGGGTYEDGDINDNGNY